MTKISEEDFPKIEKEMRKVIAANYPFERSEKPIGEALQWAKDTTQPYKEELLNDLGRAGTTVAKDLDVSELGLASDKESVVKNVSFYKERRFY
jgi:threonyl-tRNA synthetase